jgi:hypothetical protein
MTTLLIVFLLGLGIVLTKAQVVNTPDKSKTHFYQKYPGAQDVDWDNNITNYTATFKVNNNTYKAHYHIDVTWDYTVMYMTEADLPQAMKDTVDRSCVADWKPKSVTHVEKNRGEHCYRVEREKGLEERFILFDKDGE